MSHWFARAVSFALCASLFWVSAAARADDAQPPKPSEAAAGMLEAMREKGIITEEEYQDLYKRQAIYEMEQKQAASLPGWLKEWTFGGDATVRFDQIDRGGQIDQPFGKILNSKGDPVDLVNGAASAKRNRFRFRLRLGAERSIADDFLVGFRIATGASSSFGGDTGNFENVDFTRRLNADPRSAFVTAGDYFAPKGVAVDRVYISYRPHLVEGLSFTVGKMQNPFVSPEFSGDFLVWDNDISPEGAQMQYGFHMFGERMWVNLRGSYYVIDEVPAATLQPTPTVTDPRPTAFPDIDERDPFMYALQGDMGGDVTPFLRVGTRVAYYDLRDINARTAAAMEDLGNTGDAIKNNPLFFFATGESFQTNGASRGEARELVWDVFSKITPYEGWSLTPWFQLTHMFGASDQNYGYGTGFDLMLPTNTKLTFMYASLPRNSTIALFTDSDFFDGFVNARGFGITAVQWFNRWTSLRASYYVSTPINLACPGLPNGSLLCDSANFEQRELAFFREQVLDRERFLIDLAVKF